ncbi:hypothetical protein MHH52_06890 [Paenibacillus sp. FSL K6-0276]|uniref:hypothetical protein n=1 Tax=Paenibacillus sp. FSL K6-0276 TaxID=2921450 RepID=UPI0030ED9078
MPGYHTRFRPSVQIKNKRLLWTRPDEILIDLTPAPYEWSDSACLDASILVQQRMVRTTAI